MHKGKEEEKSQMSKKEFVKVSQQVLKKKRTAKQSSKAVKTRYKTRKYKIKAEILEGNLKTTTTSKKPTKRGRKKKAAQPPKSKAESRNITDESTDTSVECEDCGKVFSHQKYLTVHVGRVHQPMEPVQCSVCNKVLYNREGVLNHERLHSGQQPFKCRYCDERFSSSRQRDVSMVEEDGL